ncbi:MAG TPA: FAD-dependent oxidoreductase, partial [Burkholderiaceae bacterium]|nr:FAD-dependent oxidoreductase [Burkholderiaceae bacterium]
MASERYDVVVIGAGPAGYIAAVRAAQLGFRVACAEKWTNPKGELALGGTCLNVGCIPSKALLASSEKYEEAMRHLGDHGIEVAGARIDLAKMIARKDGIVTKMTKGIEFLFRKNKIAWLKGHARFTGRGEGGYALEIATAEGTQRVGATHVIVATGSKARHLPGVPVDNEIVCDNVGALSLSSVPKRLGVIGAGVIGLELGSVWRRLGAEVVVLEALPGFLAACDEAVSKEAWKLFTKQGLKIHLGVKIGEVAASKKGVSIAWTDAQGAAQTLEVDRLIVSVGRVPNTDGLNLEAIGLAVDERGFVPV